MSQPFLFSAPISTFCLNFFVGFSTKLVDKAVYELARERAALGPQRFAPEMDSLFHDMG
jgi:hypothetical protein